LLTEGTFPEQLKCSKGKLLYKKGEKSCIINYRPISLLLLLKSTIFGILGKAGQWFKSYLNDRTQKEETVSPNSNCNTYSN
jgi:hypothetical protein